MANDELDIAGCVQAMIAEIEAKTKARSPQVISVPVSLYSALLQSFIETHGAGGIVTEPIEYSRWNVTMKCTKCPYENIGAIYRDEVGDAYYCPQCGYSLDITKKEEQENGL